MHLGRSMRGRPTDKFGTIEEAGSPGAPPLTSSSTAAGIYNYCDAQPARADAVRGGGEPAPRRQPSRTSARIRRTRPRPSFLARLVLGGDLLAVRARPCRAGWWVARHAFPPCGPPPVPPTAPPQRTTAPSETAATPTCDKNTRRGGGSLAMTPQHPSTHPPENAKSQADGGCPVALHRPELHAGHLARARGADADCRGPHRLPGSRPGWASASTP